MDRHLELQVNRALFHARLFERALHHRGPWTMHWGSRAVPAFRTVANDCVIFTAAFDATAQEDPTRLVELRCDGDLVTIKEILPPEIGPFQVEWVIGLSDRERV